MKNIKSLKTVIILFILLILLFLKFLTPFFISSLGGGERTTWSRWVADQIRNAIDNYEPPPAWEWDWVINGKHKAFEFSTMEKLRAVAEEGDVDELYGAFSRNAKENVGYKLKAQTEELIRFLSEDVTSWESDGGYESEKVRNGVVKSEGSTHIYLYVGENKYFCQFNEKRYNSNESNTEIYNIGIYPIEMNERYTEFKMDGPGITIIYKVPKGFEVSPQDDDEGA